MRHDIGIRVRKKLIMTAVSLSDAKQTIGSLLDKVVKQQEPIFIMEQGKSLAVIAPMTQDIPDPFARHPAIMGVKINCDLTAPASEDEWPEACR